MGARGKGVVEISSGQHSVAEMEEIAGRHGRRIFMGTALALYNEQYPRRAIEMFDACSAAQARGNNVHIQLTCQPLSFDFTLASAYPFYSHEAFEPIKAFSPDELKAVFRDPGFRERFRQNLAQPRPGTVFQGNWNRVVVAVPVMRKNAGLANRNIADIAREQGARPARRDARSRPRRGSADGVSRPVLQCRRRGCGRIAEASGRGRGVVRCRRASDVSVRRRVRAVPARALGARARAVRPARGRAPADQPSGRALRHSRSRPDRDRRLCRSAAVRPGQCRGVAGAPRSTICRAAARARSATRRASTASLSTASRCSTARTIARSPKGPGQVLDRFLPSGPGVVRSAAE